MPGFLQTLGGWVAQAAGFERPPNDPMDGRFWGVHPTSTMAGVAVNAGNGLDLDVVQSVLERLGGTVSTLPLMVFERDGDSRRPAKDHPLFKVLHRRPNPRQTSQEFRDEQERHLAYWRNAYARIIPDPETGYPVGALEPIHPARMQDVFRGSDGWVYYSVQRLAPASGVDTYREDEIFHIRKAPLTQDGLRGIPVWQTAKETLGRALAVEQFGGLFFANGGAGGGTLEHPGTFKSKDERNDFLEAWRNSSTGAKRHSDRLLLYGVQYKRDIINNDEAQFLETKKEMGSAVCRLWNFPPHMAGLLDKATFSNIEQQSIEYVVHTLAPHIAAWEQAASRDLLIGEDQDRYFVEFNVSGLLRGDFKTRWAGYAVGRQWGWLSANDVRQLENMDGIGPAGDVYSTPLNMVPAGTVADTDTSDSPQDPEDAQEDTDAP